MTKITSHALYKKNTEIKEKKKKIRRFLKTRSEGDVMTCCGRLFHTRDAATGNDRSHTIVRRVRRMTSIDDDAKRSLHHARESAGRLRSSARYGGSPDDWGQVTSPVTEPRAWTLNGEWNEAASSRHCLPDVGTHRHVWVKMNS